jgi:hypothetical protein
VLCNPATWSFTQYVRALSRSPDQTMQRPSWWTVIMSWVHLLLE